MCVVSKNQIESCHQDVSILYSYSASKGNCNGNFDLFELKNMRTMATWRSQRFDFCSFPLNLTLPSKTQHLNIKMQKDIKKVVVA